MCLRRKVDIRYVARKREALRYFNIEAGIALFVALLINIACVGVFAVGFYGRPGAADIGLENAGKYLGAAFGQPMQYIWAIGLLAAGTATSLCVHV
jgi:natural resistance-associated macrophage protein 2